MTTKTKKMDIITQNIVTITCEYSMNSKKLVHGRFMERFKRFIDNYTRFRHYENSETFIVMISGNLNSSVEINSRFRNRTTGIFLVLQHFASYDDFIYNINCLNGFLKKFREFKKISYYIGEKCEVK